MNKETFYQMKIGDMYVKSVVNAFGKIDIRLSDTNRYINDLTQEEKETVLKFFPDAKVRTIEKSVESW